MKRFLVLLSFLTCVFYANAIKSSSSGDLTALKDSKKVNVQFTYEDMKVGRITEKEFLERIAAKYNKDNPGYGDSFVKEWEANKKDVYPYKFIELFEKYSGIKCNASNTYEEYTIIVNTSFFDPGFDVFVVHHNAQVSICAKVVKAKEPENVIGEITIQNIPGRLAEGYDYASHITEAYAKAGKMVAKILKKAIK